MRTRHPRCEPHRWRASAARRFAPPTSAHNGRLRRHAPLRSPRPALVASLPRSLRGCPALLAHRAADGAARLILSPRSPRCEHCTPTQHHDDSRPSPRLSRTVPVRLCPGKTVRLGMPVTPLAISRPDTAAQPLRYTTSAEAAPLAT